MKAYLVSEKLDFERGVDPKEAMNLGLKNKFIQLFSKSLGSGGGFQLVGQKLKKLLRILQLKFLLNRILKLQTRLVLDLVFQNIQ